MAIDGQLAMGHAALSWAYLWHGEHDKAIAEGQLAIDLDPDDVLALERFSFSMIFAGEAEASLSLIERARRLNPSFTYDFVHGVAMFMMAKYRDAIADTQRSFESSPHFVPAGLYLTASYALAGDQSEAEETAAKVKKSNPSYQLSGGLFTQFKIPEDRERFVDAQHQAGFS